MNQENPDKPFNIAENRKKNIIDLLKQYNVLPTEDIINEVFQIQKTHGCQYRTAVKRYIEKMGINAELKNQTVESHSVASEGGSMMIQDAIVNPNAEALANSILNAIETRALLILNERIKNGNWGITLALGVNNIFGEATNLINASQQAVNNALNAVDETINLLEAAKEENDDSLNDSDSSNNTDSQLPS